MWILYDLYPKDHVQKSAGRLADTMAQSMAEQDVEVGLGDSPGVHGDPKVVDCHSMSTTRCSTLGTSDAGSLSDFKARGAPRW